MPDGAILADEPISILLHEVIPPAFVRLDGPDDDNIVTKVMALDVDTNKFDLLVSLGRVAHQDAVTDADLETMEHALDTLADIEDADGVEQYIERNLL